MRFLNLTFFILMGGALTGTLLTTCSMGVGLWALTVEWELGLLGACSLLVPFVFDVHSCVFMSTVLTIASAVILFSKSYMSEEKHFIRFHLLVMAFVLSMLFLITSPNLMSILLGWDGLGVTSYLLVIYFQSSKSFNAGMLTALTNRIGDVFILVTIALMSGMGSWNFYIWAHAPSSLNSHELCILVLLLAASTKSAQVPFSAWLPAAMAAPTPVSSLVHSSTLVTAGVYLLFRFSEMLSLASCLPYILSVGILTMILAGVSALSEMDMKKIVALSTLSQLGLMMSTIGLGFYEVAFFHLLTHAFFKALLFMTVGNMIHLSSDFQDLRKIKLTEQTYPVTLGFSLVANCSLCGLPFMAGFYSKDLVLELMLNSKHGLIIIFFMLFAVALTVLYTVRFLFMTSSGGLLSTSCMKGGDNDWLMALSMAILWPLAISGGSGLLWILFSTPAFIGLPVELKNLTLAIVASAFLTGGFLQTTQPQPSTGGKAWSWGSMWALPFISTFYVNQLSLCASALARKLDLSWVVSGTWAPLIGLSFLSAIDKSTAFRSFVVPFTLILAYALLIWVFYLRM